MVSQQGRVSLEADANEAEEIRTAESRAELLDIVGPTGSPDDGFKIAVSGDADFKFSIGAGIIYVGGVRVVTEDGAATYLKQKDAEWIDYPAGAPAPYPTAKMTELVYLAVTEQEVSAVEDLVLREVALGGPDTAGRTRMIQRVHRAPMAGTDCEQALDAILEATSNLAFDPETMRLASKAQLRVDFVQVSTGAANPCQPTAQPGFLGAENQLIRLQAIDPGTLLWGYDNASSLYRATIDASSRKKIVLKGVPVDVYHQPRQAQWVEVLGSAVKLGDDAWVANAAGAAVEIEGYTSTGNVITLKTDIPQAVFDSSPPQVFVRIWEGRFPFSANPATETSLVTGSGSPTGLRVYTKGAAVAGDYWMVGVRPTMPQAILPERLRQFQPPDGPSRWATPLATIAWDTPRTGAVHDCRRPFDNLVELTRAKCCELKILPGDDAQKIITRRLQWIAAHGIQALHVRFAAGTFTFDTPLVFKSEKRGELTVSGCGTKIVAPTQEVALLLQDWDCANVFDLSVEATVAKPGKGKKLRQDTVPAAPGDEFRHLTGAITIRNCRSSTIERVVAVCGTGDSRAASCLTIRNDDGGADARVRSCRLSAGSRQVGVLLVNVDRATVEDNQIGWHAPDRARIPPADLRRMIINTVEYDRENSGTVSNFYRFNAHLLPGNHFISYIAPADLVASWEERLTALDEVLAPRGNTIGKDDRRRAQRAIASVVTHIIHRHRDGRLGRAELDPFWRWMDRALKLEETVAAAGYGIVVGGGRAGDIRVLNNTISDVMDGIHIGLSVRGSPHTHLFVERVQVAGNTISVRVPWYDRRAHAGIFVGNANVATVRDNRVDIQRQQTRDGDKRDSIATNDPGTKRYAAMKAYVAMRKYNTARAKMARPLKNATGDLETGRERLTNDFGARAAAEREKLDQDWGNAATRGAEGIRIWGLAGQMLLVTGNCTQHADIGIHVIQESVPQYILMFLLTQNAAIDTPSSIEASSGVTLASDNVPPP